MDFTLTEPSHMIGDQGRVANGSLHRCASRVKARDASISPLGFLVFKSGYIPRILGVLLIIAGFGYLIDSFGKFLSPNYDLTIAMFTFIGEVLLLLWLLVKGINVRLDAIPNAV